MITAFYINLAARLNKDCNLTSQPFVDHIDVMKVCSKYYLKLYWLYLIIDILLLEWFCFSFSYLLSW